MSARTRTTWRRVDAVSDDLNEVEMLLYELQEEDEEAEDGGDEDETVYQTTCPNCGEENFFDEDTLADGDMLCPSCGEKLEFDLSDLSGCGGCCGHCGDEAEDEDGKEDE